MRLTALLLSTAVVLAACAEGSEIGDGGGGSGEGGTITGAGGSDATTGSTTSSTTSSTTGSGGEGGAGDGGMAAGGSGQGGSPPVCDFTSIETCQTAEPMNEVSGDEGGTAVRTGSRSQWFKIHVTETDGGVFETDLSYDVVLTSPPGVTYALTVFESGDGAGSPNCNATPMAGAGNPAVVSNGWDDSQPIGGEDDSRWLAIHVEHVSGDDCGPGAEWTLEVIGAP